MIVAGVGSRRGVSAEEVCAAVRGAMERHEVKLCDISLMATPAVKGGEAGIIKAALDLGLLLVMVPQAQLEAAGKRVMTHSERVVALMGVPSVAEASALAVAGRRSSLVGPRFVLGPVTCALAREAEKGTGTP
ncbi:cobalamin biosynthesis protein [Ancylobacter mangrovi]|uniref:Cobalamin biosynthesis protein n=1 Tax=Ancylobacter mangrovi TaxID=2972472 RepID=A0A9X2T2X7_9HYPH|nr:cobalamin biosynthesis protein [Ancylobacter mangrovi]MCS0496372.1 cobalamin biosynthesis protein [Ancylobacter mangrovi]MCS0504384.1 cobalamin biosynthesis protein [Ancylobacter mangrovi]